MSVLLARSGAGDKLPAHAVLVIVPTLLGVTTMVMDALAPLARSPSSQETTPLASAQLPTVDVAETNRTSAGSRSMNVAFAAAPGPPLVTRIV